MSRTMTGKPHAPSLQPFSLPRNVGKEALDAAHLCLSVVECLPLSGKQMPY